MIVGANVGLNGVNVDSGVKVSAGVNVGGTPAGNVSGAVSVRDGSRGGTVSVGVGVLVGGLVATAVLLWVLQANTVKISSPTNTPSPRTEMPSTLTIQRILFITSVVSGVINPADYPTVVLQVLIHPGP